MTNVLQIKYEKSIGDEMGRRTRKKKINQAQHKRCSRCSGKGRSRNKIKKEKNKSSATQKT